MTEQPPWSLHFGKHGRRIIVAGHSHVLCLMQALGEQWRDDVSVAYNTDLHDGPPFDDDYWRWLHSITNDELIGIVWNGNQHHASFLVQPEPAISVWRDGSHDHVATEAMIVPRTMLRELWEPSFTQLRFALDLLSGDRRVVLLGTPPPKRQVDVFANLSTEVWFDQAARELGIEVADLPVTAEADRLTMWMLLQEMLQDIAAEYGVPYEPSPSSTTDDGGFLLTAYSDSDATHANAAYGHAVCDVLEGMVGP